MGDAMKMENCFRDDHGERTAMQSAAFVTAVIVCCVFAVFFSAFHFVRAAGNCDLVLDEKINPNTACAGGLIRLPNVGPSRAMAIIEYRNSCDEAQKAFKTGTDLQKIKGIGPKTVESITPWLCFE